MKCSPKSELVVDALLMAVWGRRSRRKVLIHSDQGVEYTRCDRKDFLEEQDLEACMSRRGNCHDNAVQRASSRY